MAALRTQEVTTGRRPLRSLAQGPWAVPLASGALIALAFAVRTWSATAFDLGLVAATLVAGRPIAQRALLDLRIRRIGLEALVRSEDNTSELQSLMLISDAASLSHTNK